MIPITQLRSAIQGNRIIPQFLDERDHPWLRLLIEEHARFLGRPRRELKKRLKHPFSFAAPPKKLNLVNHLLLRSIKTEMRSKVLPQKIRADLFRSAAQCTSSREVILCTVGDALGVTETELLDGLFADLPDERFLCQMPLDLSAGELALRANLAFAQSLISRSVNVCIRLSGNSRTVVQNAKRMGLICVLENLPEADSISLRLSGPYALFRRTTMYGSALAKIVPILAWCHRFHLVADCQLGTQIRTFELQSNDPIFPSEPPPLYDSELEEGFAKDFNRITDRWSLIRECEPLDANGTLIFPDFVIQHLTDASKRWHLEIMGYWTPQYLVSKLERLHRAEHKNFILCIREDYNCSNEVLPSYAHIVRFKKVVNPSDVLRILEEG